MRPLLEPLGLSRLVPGDARLHARAGAAHARPRRLGQGGIQVCYEIIFSGQVVDRAHRPDLPLQSLERRLVRRAGARRSISPRRGCARSRKACRSCARPPTGISAVIDARRRGSPVPADGTRRASIDGCVPPAACRRRCSPGSATCLPLGLALAVWSLGALHSAAGPLDRAHKRYLYMRFRSSAEDSSPHAQQLSLHVRKRLRRPSGQGRRPDFRRDRRSVPVQGSGSARRLRDADHHPAGRAGRRDPLQGRLRERRVGARRARGDRADGRATRSSEIGYEQDGFHWQTLPTSRTTSTASPRTSRRASTRAATRTRAPATRASCSASPATRRPT